VSAFAPHPSPLRLCLRDQRGWHAYLGCLQRSLPLHSALLARPCAIMIRFSRPSRGLSTRSFRAASSAGNQSNRSRTLTW